MVPSPDSRYHSLDAWRGLACLLVVVLHSTYYAVPTAGDPAATLVLLSHRFWIGVPLFFVISGYCISATAQASARKGHRTRDYFYRRVRRIFPPYLVCVAAAFLFITLGERLRPGLFTQSVGPMEGIPDPWSLTPWQWLGNLTLTEGWRPHLTSDPLNWFVVPAWTLGYEEQFYAVTGLILLVAPKRFFLGAAAVTVGVVAIFQWRYRTQGFFFDGQWLHFAAGILVYYAVNHASRRSLVLLLLPLAAGIGWTLLDLGELAHEHKTERQAALAAYSFAALLIALHRWDKTISSSRAVAPLTLCGTMCYSLYLVHWPICKAISHLLSDAGLTSPTATMLVTVPACLAASLAAGWLFHIGVERRFLNSPQHRPAQDSPKSHRQQLRALQPVPTGLVADSRDPGNTAG